MRTKLNNIKDYKKAPRTVLSQLNDKQKREVLKLIGYDENEALFGYKSQFKYYPIDFASTDKKLLNEAMQIFESIYQKANKDYDFVPDKLSTTRILWQIVKEIKVRNLSLSYVEEMAITDLPEKILSWIYRIGTPKFPNKSPKPIKIDHINENSEENIERKLSDLDNQKKIDLTLKELEQTLEGMKPERRKIIAIRISRKPLVAKLVKEKAHYKCEICKQLGFEMTNGKRYVEVHHKYELSKGGLDLPSNIIAVCPLCHKIIHHGSDAEKKRLGLI